jgi:hypothetical protein
MAFALDQALHSIFHYIEDSFSISPSFTFHLPLYRIWLWKMECKAWANAKAIFYIVEDGM